MSEQECMAARIDANKWVLVYEHDNTTYARTVSVSGKVFTLGTRVRVDSEEAQTE